MIVNADNLILGRLASFVAKQALLGEKIDIINIEKAVVSGKRLFVLAHYRQKRERGYVTKGPFFPREPERLVRRTIRGMLPYKQEKGRKAFARIKCYQGVPKALAGQPAETVKGADASRLTSVSYITVHHLTRHLGHD